MICFTTELKKFNDHGEKTGWTYIEVSSGLAQQLKPNNRKGFRVKGMLDDSPFDGVAMIPIGEGDFIIAINASMRKATMKQKGDSAKVVLEVDEKEYKLCEDLVDCLKEEPKAATFFYSLAKGHQNYFSKWIESAKTIETKTKRIADSINALAKCWSYSEMIRSLKDKNDELEGFLP